jgi:hypothetical protein
MIALQRHRAALTLGRGLQPSPAVLLNTPGKPLFHEGKNGHAGLYLANNAAEKLRQSIPAWIPAHR